MKTPMVIVLIVVMGGLIFIGTLHKPKPNPEAIAARHAEFAAQEAEKNAIRDFCAGHGKPFSTTISYDQDAATQYSNGFNACMKEHGVKGYEDAPMPVKK